MSGHRARTTSVRSWSTQVLLEPTSVERRRQRRLLSQPPAPGVSQIAKLPAERVHPDLTRETCTILSASAEPSAHDLTSHSRHSRTPMLVRTVNGLLLLLSAVGCAKGFQSVGVGPDGPPPPEVAGAAGQVPVMYKGDPCVTLGERTACICTDGMSEGIKSCGADANSPTKGSYSPCTACAPIPRAGISAPMTAGTRATAGGAGAGGRIGRGTSPRP